MAYLLPNSSRFDRAAILRAAHWSAVMYAATSGTYARALREGLRAAWAEARAERLAFIVRGAVAPTPAAVVAINRQIVRIEMKDRMTSADFAAVAALREQAARLNAPA